jgi:hypothetical protein
MSLTVAILIYLGMIGLVSNILLYYFKVLRPKDEARFNHGRNESDF